MCHASVVSVLMVVALESEDHQAKHSPISCQLDHFTSSTNIMYNTASSIYCRVAVGCLLRAPHSSCDVVLAMGLGYHMVLSVCVCVCADSALPIMEVNCVNTSVGSICSGFLACQVPH